MVDGLINQPKTVITTVSISEMRAIIIFGKLFQFLDKTSKCTCLFSFSVHVQSDETYSNKTLSVHGWCGYKPSPCDSTSRHVSGSGHRPGARVLLEAIIRNGEGSLWRDRTYVRSVTASLVPADIWSAIDRNKSCWVKTGYLVGFTASQITGSARKVCGKASICTGVLARPYQYRMWWDAVSKHWGSEQTAAVAVRFF
jgi:hypothetical protein